MTDQSTALARVQDAIFSRDVHVDDAGNQLAEFETPQQALVLRRAFDDYAGDVTAKNYHFTAETGGRRLENVMLGVPDVPSLVAQLAEDGDVEILVNVLRGHAGEFSGIADHLTEDILHELVTSDSIRTDDRKVRIAYTLLIETNFDNEVINNFFSDHITGRKLLREIQSIAAHGDDNASHIIRVSEMERGVRPPVGIIDPNDEDESENSLAHAGLVEAVSEGADEFDDSDEAAFDDDEEEDDF